MAIFHPTISTITRIPYPKSLMKSTCVGSDYHRFAQSHRPGLFQLSNVRDGWEKLSFEHALDMEKQRCAANWAWGWGYVDVGLYAK